jgi:uncharacterized protein YjcR
MANEKETQKALAERLFINDNMTAKAIAETLGVNEKTIGSWRAKGEWDIRKSTYLSSPLVIKEKLLEEMQKILTGEKSNIDADALRKMHIVFESMGEKTNPQTCLSVFKEFDNWMAEQDPVMALNFTKWHKDFIAYKISME